jgi:class 3 adenylate cyclase
VVGTLGRCNSGRRARLRRLHHRGGSGRCRACRADASEDNYTKHAAAVGAGWLARAERLLAESTESVVHGYLARLRAVLAFEGAGDLDAALGHADEALEIATRFGDRDLTALALHDRGRVLLDAGRVAEGMALMDEATAAAVSGELRPLTTGFIYCNTIGACEHIADYARAGEWTEAAKRWCERLSVAGFPGMCRVHRASIMRLRGAWAEAEDEAQRACSELVDFNPSYAAEGFYEIGEIRLRVGDFAGAEDAFRQAQELGRVPQPGLARLRLAQGRVDAADSCMRRALADETLEVLRARLLPARAETALAAGDLETAEEAAVELAETSERFGTPALAAMAASTRALVELEKRNASAAVTALRAGIAHWNAIGAPYETARARLDLASAYRAAGDDHAAAEELALAHSTFLRLGAKPDARRAEELLARAGAVTPTRLARTLMFTDICRSTELLEAIGDEAWRDLLSWHDATLRSLFEEHGGEEIDHAGDGFFASFPEARAAVECAQAIQRRLTNHRLRHGFAPQLRIGLHATEATRDGTAYRGKGVHEAARIASIAEAGEIVATCETLRAAGVVESGARSVKLKGLAEPLEVASVAWR